jgi:hypothetical protein
MSNIWSVLSRGGRTAEQFHELVGWDQYPGPHAAWVVAIRDARLRAQG